MSFTSLDQIWMLGDSMTQMSFGEDGIGARFADTYVRKLDVINRGYGGYNSRWDAIVFEQIFPTCEQREAQSLPRIRLLTIWLGTNDCVEEGRPQYVSPADFKLELAKIINVARERSPDTHIVLITPGPQQIARLERNFYLPHDPPIKIDRSNAQAELYVRAIIELGAKEGVPVVNIWDPLWKAAGSQDEDALEQYYSDGLHLAAPGYKIVWDVLFKTIVSNFPELIPTNLAADWPGHDLVDPTTLESSLKQGMHIYIPGPRAPA